MKVTKMKCFLPGVMLGVVIALPAFSDDTAEQMQNAISSAKSTAEGVTLPLYPNHDVTIHYLEAPPIPGVDTENALPTIMLTSSDSVEDVVTFYDDRLEGFTRLNIADDNVTFGKDIPADLDATDMERWMNTIPYHEHVSIYSQFGGTNIEIGYQPE